VESLLHQVLSGLVTGGVYASLALALVMIYQSTRTLNFAQGEMAMFSTYLAWTQIQEGIPFWWALVITVVVSFVAGMLIERLVIRRLQDRSLLATVVVMVGLLVIFNSAAGWIWGYTLKSVPSPFPSSGVLGNLFVSQHEIGTFAITLAMLAAIFVFFRFTPLGLAMRAAAQDPQSSRLVGIRVGTMLGLGWGLAAAIGAVAGVLIAHVVFLDPNLMSGILLYAFAGALLGGIDNPWGAVIGGYIVGVMENLLGVYVFGNNIKLTAVLVLIVAVLTVMPDGLFGKTTVIRV